jgi:arylsulfatase A-like enzyme
MISNMSRREFLKTAGAASLMATSLVGCAEMASKSSVKSFPTKPNVILIMPDDQGYGHLSCHGNPVLKTPNIDKLHAEGIRLTDFHVSPTCSPTRAALMTGRYNVRTGVWHTIMGRHFLRKDEVTMADVFSDSGYRTGIFGKWHLGDNYPFRPHDRGFDEALVHLGGGIGHGNDYWGNDYFDDTYYRNGVSEKFEGYCADVWFDEAMKFIEKNKDNSFFCYLPSNTAHAPFHIAEKYSNLYKDKGLEYDDTHLFYGMLANIDENVGRLMDRLAQLDLVDNTIIIFMTDNGGDSVGGPDEFNSHMRGSKGSQYEGGHRVPCFIHWPGGGLTGGRNIDRLTAHIDIIPTLIELCSLKKPADVKFDGKSLVPLISGDSKNWPKRTLVVDSQRIDHPIKWRRSCTMTDRWRLINGKELYDIKADPRQEKNIARKHPNVVKQLRTAYEKWWDDVSERFDEYSEIIIGSDEENPTCLVSHDLHGEVVFYVDQVKEGAPSDGFWVVDVERSGLYEFSLRRWPQESNRPISDTVDIHELEPDYDGFTVTHARLKVADIDETKPIPPGAREVTFKVRLKAGSTRVQGWFINHVGNGRIYGAYYVYVKRT